MGKIRYLFTLFGIFILNNIFAYTWHYSDFFYRIPIKIFYNGTTDIQNISINLTIDTASLIATGKMNPDCSDIRFTYYNTSSEEEIEVPYWINETTCNTTNTEIWIRVPILYAGQNITVYMYYGNPNATSKSNESAVFDIYQGSYDTGTRYYDTGLYTVVDFGKTKFIKEGNITINYYDSDCDTWWIRVYCDGIEIYYSGTRSGCSGYLTTIDLSQRTCQRILVRMYDTEQNDNVRVYGEYYVKTYDPEMFNTTFYLGEEEVQLKVWFEIQSPVNNTYYGTNDIPVEAIVYLDKNYTLDRVDLILDNVKVYSWYNVSNQTQLSYTIYSVADGKHLLKFIAYFQNYSYESNITIFYVDTTPPVVKIIYPEPITYRINYNNTTIPIYVTTSDNLGIRNCTIELWNGTIFINKCNERFLLDIGVVPDGQYYVRAIAYDYVNLSDTDVVYFTLDYSQGYVVYDAVKYPDNVLAKPFNVSANITCLGDWCDDVYSTIIYPSECDILSTRKIYLGDMNEYDTKEVYWTIYCRKNDNYTFIINTTVANGNYAEYKFTLYPPKTEINIYPIKPTQYDDLYFVIYPQGYGRDVTYQYKIIRYRAGEGAVTIVSSNITIQDNVNYTVYVIPNQNINPGDVYIFQVRLIDPLDFYEEYDKNVTVYDSIPPQIITVNLKYTDRAPHDDYQIAYFTVSDNYLIDRVELMISFDNQSYIKYKTKYYNQYLVSDNFTINHTNYSYVKLFLVVYDKYNNTAVSPIYEYRVVKNNPPYIEIRYPYNKSVTKYSEETISFKVYDDFTKNITCKINNETLYVNSGELKAYIVKLSSLENNITIECVDDQGNKRKDLLIIYYDPISPVLSDINYNVTGALVSFNVTVEDNFLLKEMRVYVIVNNTTVTSNTYALYGNESLVSFTLSFVSYIGQVVKVLIEIEDKAGNVYKAPPLYFAVSKPTPAAPITINLPPKIKIVKYRTYPGYVVELEFEVDDESLSVYCDVIYDSKQISIGSVETRTRALYNLTLPSAGVYRVFIKCIDDQGLQGISNTITVNVTYIPKTPKQYIDVYVKAVTIKDPKVSTPFTLGTVITAIGVLTKASIAINIGLSMMIGGPLIVYGLVEGDPLAAAAGTGLSILVWIITDIILKRRLLFI